MKIEKNNSYPEAPITIIPIELWDDEKQDQYIADRVKLHQDAEYERLTGGSLPLCPDLERWARPATFAVKKAANKRALRVFDSRLAAQQYFDAQGFDSKYCIEERKGKNIRCEANYCGVAQWCDQYEAIKNGNL